MALTDVHSHHYPNTYLDACLRSDSGLETYWRADGRLVVTQDGAVALAAPQPMPTVEERLQRMDAAGITTQLLSVSAPNVYPFPETYRRSLTTDLNDELIDYASAAGGRLRVLVSLPLPDVDGALHELDRCLSKSDVAGVFLCTTLHRRQLDDPAVRPLFAELARRETAVMVHPTVAACTEGIREYALALGFDFLAETTNAIARLTFSGTFDRFPGIRWVFTHLGGTVPFVLHRFDNYYHQFPECRQYLDRLPSDVLSDLYFDTVTTHSPALRCAMETFGTGRLLFGTDYPHVPGGLDVFVNTVGDVVRDPDALDSICWRTAADVFALDTLPTKE